MKTETVRLTAAEALVRWMVAQRVELEGAGGQDVPLFAGVFAIFGHGNVAGLGHALAAHRERLPTLRAHNEQAMGHAAVAFAKAKMRRQVMACTTSIGPGATNLVTAAAVAHVNRLPVLFLPGEVFASRAPDPVLQQLEHPGDPWVTANETLRPVSRLFDRIYRPEQLLAALPAVARVLTDPAECGPVTLALPQDVQTEAFDFPLRLFEPVVHRRRRLRPDAGELARAAARLRAAKRPLVVAGGGVLYAGAAAALDAFARRFGLPVGETQAGKGALPWDHPLAMGGIGVTGTTAANALAAEADVVLALGTRLSDFTTASRTLFRAPELTLIGANVSPFDASKHQAEPLVGDALEVLRGLEAALADVVAPEAWTRRAQALAAEWQDVVEEVTARSGKGALPTDAQVLGAVNRAAGEGSVVVGAAGGLPGELHKLWRPSGPGSYHLEYGYSCMGYEIAGGLGVKLAAPERRVFVLLGDGSYLMLSSEIATSVALGQKLVIVVLDNRGFGCIHRLQRSTGGEVFNNLLDDRHPPVDFAAHARSMGALAEHVADLEALEAALVRANEADRTTVLVIETDPERGTTQGGAWWDVAVPEVSARPEVREARTRHRARQRAQRRP